MSEFLKEFVLQIKIIFYTVVYVFSFVPLLVLLLPVFILRLIASQAKKVLRPDLGNLIHPRSSVLSCDDYAKNPKWNLVVWLTQEELMDLESFRKDFYKNFVEAKRSDGRLRYPEYKQHYYTWWGFQFWRWEDNFDMMDHIRVYDGMHKSQSVVDDDVLLQILKELTWKPWDPRKSPWEFLQIPNYKSKENPEARKSLLLFRLHHGLGDGYYILKLLLEDIGGVGLNRIHGIPNYPKRSWWEEVLTKAFICLVGPYHSMKMVTRAYDVNGWRIPEEKMIKPMNAALTEPINFSLIKEIKNLHGVSFTAVIYSAISAGISRMMKIKGLRIPKEIHSAVAVPIPGHPQKLRNHFIFSFVALPTGITDDPVKRLKKVENNINELKRSTAPLINFMTVPLFGRIFPWMINLCLKNRHSTCLISNFPGSPCPGGVGGAKTTGMMFGAGLGPGNVGLGFTLLSLIDKIQMLSVADPNILESDEEVRQLNNLIMEEMTLLKNCSQPTNSTAFV